MKAAAMSVWIFINLLCFGMCGYLYLIWSQYWMYLEKQRLFSKPAGSPQKTSSDLNQGTSFMEKFNSKLSPNFTTLRIDYTRKNRRSAIGAFWNSGSLWPSSGTSGPPARPSNNIVRKSQGSPRFPNIHKPVLEFDNDKYICDDYTTPECKQQTSEFKELLLKEFHRVLMSDSKVFKSGLDAHNLYNVKYASGQRKDLSKEDILCALGRVQLQTITSKDEPFGRLGFHIPKTPLQQNHVFNTCAVVTSAGALLGSRLGEYIGKLLFLYLFIERHVVVT